MTASLTPGVRKLFTDANYGHLATLMKDGSPQVTTISVSDPSGYPIATIRGRVVEVTNEGAADHIDKLAKKYLGQDKYPWAQPGDVRVRFVIQPEHISGMMTD